MITDAVVLPGDHLIMWEPILLLYAHVYDVDKYVTYNSLVPPLELTITHKISIIQSRAAFSTR